MHNEKSSKECPNKNDSLKWAREEEKQKERGEKKKRIEK